MTATDVLTYMIASIVTDTGMPTPMPASLLAYALEGVSVNEVLGARLSVAFAPNGACAIKVDPSWPLERQACGIAYGCATCVLRAARLTKADARGRAMAHTLAERLCCDADGWRY